MRKTPSHLKGLAETRARSAGDVQRLQKLYEEVGKKLTEATAEVDACDRLIRKFDERLNPELIKPIRAWKGRYGNRGTFSFVFFLQCMHALGTEEVKLKG